MGFLGFDKRKEEERLRMEEEEASRKRREERMRKEAEEEERLRLEEEARRKREEERKRKEAEKERMRKEAEEKEEHRLNEAQEKRQKEAEKLFSKFEQYGTINCRILEEAQYGCYEYDDMELTAKIGPKTQWLDISYKHDINGKKYKGASWSTKDIEGYEIISKVGFRIIMIARGRACVYCPCFVFNGYDPIIIVDDNRYTVTTDDYGKAFLGSKDVEVLRYIASGRHSVTIKKNEDFYNLTHTDFEEINQFLDVCQRAGIFNQETFLKQENIFKPFALFNED